MKMFKVLIVGAGQLGSRYLQGLASLDIPLSIAVVDPFEPSLAIARERYLEVNSPCNHKIDYLTNFDQSNQCYDLAIISTPAHS